MTYTKSVASKLTRFKAANTVFIRNLSLAHHQPSLMPRFLTLMHAMQCLFGGCTSTQFNSTPFKHLKSRLKQKHMVDACVLWLVYRSDDCVQRESSGLLYKHASPCASAFLTCVLMSVKYDTEATLKFPNLVIGVSWLLIGGVNTLVFCAVASSAMYSMLLTSRTASPLGPGRAPDSETMKLACDKKEA
jgi:hypothetical protein